MKSYISDCLRLHSRQLLLHPCSRASLQLRSHGYGYAHCVVPHDSASPSSQKYSIPYGQLLNPSFWEFYLTKPSPGGQWNPEKVYVKGDVVRHNEQNWLAHRWTKGDEPGTSGKWLPLRQVE
ncbi:carbohydrate-binding protein [Endozoicomonas sp. ONNA2]|uniref:carbohydrate-binding protein n=1 Tax=Endozoicomonas sp. ONNA2 TaxID=2828741 RepID=UPI00214888E6|nr:carbohydrate-binding protein [Endozoicomonas sp. ONNA2]